MISVRCSELDRVLACPGSMTIVPIVDPRAGDDGAEGQSLHHLSAVRIVRELGGHAPDGLPNPDPAWPSLKFSKWISDFYVRHIQESVPSNWSIDVEVALSYEYDGFILSGHIDCLALSPDATRAKGFDLKSGRDPVSPAEENEQFFGYTCNLKRAYPMLECVEFDGVQPRNDPDEGFDRISHMELSGARLDQAIPTLERRVKEALSNSMQLNSGRVQCNWCPAAVQCPATRADRELMKMTLTPELIAQIKRTPDDATLADWVVAAKTLARPIEDAQELAKERIAAKGELMAKDGTRITIKTTKGSYTVKDPVALWSVLSELLPEERRAVCAKWSFTALKDQVAEHMHIPKSGKSAMTGDNIVAAKTGPFVEQGERRVFQFS